MPAAVDAEFVRQALITFLMIVASLTVHEWGHAWTAMKVGDPTAKTLGRVTFNPLAHIDLIGTVLVPLFVVFFNTASGSRIFFPGWAKPVPVNPANFRHPVRDDLLVTLAGPGANLVLALIAAVVGGILMRFVMVDELVLRLIWINVSLCIFNLVVAIPPLDGSRVLRLVLGLKEETYARLCLIGPFVLIVLINVRSVQVFLAILTERCAVPFAALAAMIRGG